MEQQSFILPTALTIETVESVLGNLKTAPLTSGRLIVDAAGVEIITTPGVQIVLALAQSLMQAGGKLTISQPSAAFTQAFATLGLGNKLTEWSSNHG